MFYTLNKQNNFCLEKSQEHSSAPVILPPPHQYTLEELETEILKKSSLGIDALKNATETIKGINYE